MGEWRDQHRRYLEHLRAEKQREQHANLTFRIVRDLLDGMGKGDMYTDEELRAMIAAAQHKGKGP